MHQNEPPFTYFLEHIFEGSPSLPFDKRFSSIPPGAGIVRPLDTGPPAPRIFERPDSPAWLPDLRARTRRPPSGPIDEGSTVTPIYKWTTATPSTVKPSERSIFSKLPTIRQRWETKPPAKEVKPTHVTSTTDWGRRTNLDNLIWVALGGFAVLALLAIFMKLGNPIRRVRRQLSNSRSANAAANVINRRHNRNLDMGSLLLLTDSEASTDTSPPYGDLPPPYSECVQTNKGDTEEPPPRFSACFVTDTNTKDSEPKVHIQPQNVLFDNFAMNDAEDGDRMRTELVLVNGRIVERPKLHLNSHNNDTDVARNDNADLKGRVAFNGETNHVKLNIY